jgi:hypothetical protein
MQALLALFLFFAFFVGITEPSTEETVGLSGTGSNYVVNSSSAQNAINIALTSEYEAGGGTVI